MTAAASTTARSPFSERTTLNTWVLIGIGLLALYIPSFVDLFRTVWSTDEQAHGPIVFSIAVWLLYRQGLPTLNAHPRWLEQALGWGLLALGFIAFFLGRLLNILSFEVSSLIVNFSATLILLGGVRAWRQRWFGLFFMLFMIPLPEFIVASATLPMKTAVSYMTELILHAANYPIARSGVILQIGQYKLLVADACAGLHTLFTLEALGLLYLNLVRHQNVFRNVALAILIVPISFTANVIRVCTLTLITYYFGDEAGQGFLHGFAGMVLFVSALLIIMGVDAILRRFDFTAKKTATTNEAAV